MERALWVGCTVLALSACDYKYVETPRSLSRETRDVPNFAAVEFEGDGRVEIMVGEPTQVVLRGSRSVIQRTATRVTDNTLHVEVQHKEWSWGKDRQRLVLQIKVPTLRSLQLDGGTDVRLQGFNGGESSISINGAARVRGSGALDRLTVHLSGAGHADLSNLEANAAKVTVDGVGSVYVHPKESLDATMNGVGAILYSGKPNQVSSSINGLGAISRRDADDDDADDDADSHANRHDRPQHVHQDEDDEDDAAQDDEEADADAI